MKPIQNIQIHSKWYLSAAVIFLAVLGSIVGQQHATVANQEIVLQFSNADISSIDVQQTIAIVEEQLQRIGVANIHVSDQEDGKMVISYYSSANVAHIKEILSKQKDLALGLVSDEKSKQPLKLPSNNQSIAYNLDVYEIQDGQHAVSNLGGKSAVELKSGQYRFLNPNFYIPSEDSYSDENAPILRIKAAIQCYIAIKKDNNLHKIPEVRAGPMS
ncbi:hypothetical protein [Gelidibacter salicanalis]|uniref:Uncharacterized protein n=1 Tax=Gelidibacter salicanalis TaxID=291193 RepID=A0A934NIK2_9FLAO|nr:hypothetical protein [Gelidibacter salicanalis]MBJ7881263.1 hypothetical protein [Gelidibacter salicanalis]